MSSFTKTYQTSWNRTVKERKHLKGIHSDGWCRRVNEFENIMFSLHILHTL